MEVNKIELCKSLVEWFVVVSGIELNGQQEPDLSDGVAMARLLHKFSPDFFTGKLNNYFMLDLDPDGLTKVYK